MPHNMASAASIARRLVQILLLIQTRSPNRPLGRTELAHACECSPRTIQRYLTYLREIAPIEFDAQQHAYTLRDRRWRFPLTELTVRDVVALAFARQTLSASGLPHQKAVLDALDKITDTLPPALRDLLNQSRIAFHAEPLSRDYSAAPLETLQQAIIERRAIRMDYESRTNNQRGWRLLEPYALNVRDGGRYEVEGWCRERQMIRTFALDAIHEVELTDERFTIRQEAWARFQEQADFRGLRGGEPVEVAVRFLPEVAAYARRHRWPTTLTTETETSGALWLRGTAAHRDALIAELLRWRRYVEVHGGAELQQAYLEELDAMRACQQNLPPL
jgi:predicted DNA-binding transcriptional regulator YafY